MKICLSPFSKGRHGYQPVIETAPKGFKHDASYIAPKGCEYPVTLECIFCSTRIKTRCKSTKEEKCRHCAALAKSMRIQQFTEALSAVDLRVEVTASAPGKEFIPWDKSACQPHAGEPHSGKKFGCRVSDKNAHYWNSTFTSRWNDFMTHLRKRYPDIKIEYGNVRENQKRGVLHNHAQFIFPDGAPGDLHKFNATIKKLLVYHGFGVQSSVKVKRGEIRSAVSYSVKYMTKGSERAVTYNEKYQRYEKGGYHTFTRSRSFGRSLVEISNERYEKYLKSLEKRRLLSMDKAVSMLAIGLGASPFCEAEGNTNATPLDSTYTRSYADT